MAKRKPRWQKTNVSWEIRRIIWQRWAQGDTVPQTVNFFELHQGEYRNVPFDRGTIKKVKDELLDIPAELASKLINELPEVKSFLLEQRPDLKVELEQLSEGSEATPKWETDEKQSNEIVDASLHALTELDIDKLHHARKIFEELDNILNEKDVFEIAYKIEAGNALFNENNDKIQKFLYYANLDATYHYEINELQEYFPGVV